VIDHDKGTHISHEIERRCVEDGWSFEMTRCWRKASQPDHSYETCLAMLSPVQRENFRPGIPVVDAAAPGPAELDCDAVGAHVIELSVSSLPERARATPAAAKARAMYVGACREDQWSPRMAACIVAATQLDRLPACFGELTAAQLEGLTRRAKAAVAP
jgi:hypothetical protein